MNNILLQKATRLLFLLLLTNLVGYVGGTFVTPDALVWYDTLIQSNLTPPNMWFGIIWTVLYFMMAVSAWLVWGKVSPRPFVLQLAFNLLWPFFFFYLKNPIFAWFDVLTMIFFIIWTIKIFYRVSKVSAWLMVPTLVWSCFATYLTTIVVLYNTEIGIWLGLI